MIQIIYNLETIQEFKIIGLCIEESEGSDVDVASVSCT